MTLNDIFMAALESEVTVQFETKTAYDNMRTMLIRKLRTYNKRQALMGIYSDLYVSASITQTEYEITGKFVIKDAECRVRTKTYEVTDI